MSQPPIVPASFSEPCNIRFDKSYNLSEVEVVFSTTTISSIPKTFKISNDTQGPQLSGIFIFDRNTVVTGSQSFYIRGSGGELVVNIGGSDKDTASVATAEYATPIMNRGQGTWQ
ncbi:hypothetical protein FRC08_014383 [Ceratobasidium sp. 394]|nr:hypothetical protein FRC08_014383 [Ceratobasidium sp. 394]KAG9096802.1 hypothetical protein FS749_007695 [Ceratobasidium sp. UAMH 11750]